MSIKQVMVCDECGETIESCVYLAVQLTAFSISDGTPRRLLNGHLCQSCVERYHHYSPKGIFSSRNFRTIEESEEEK